MGSLFKTPKQTTAATGLNSTPTSYQGLYNAVLGNANAGVGGITSNMFNPATGDTANAYNSIMQGFTPTAESLSSDISMLMGNPYNESVINQINREAAGQNSLVNQAATQAGQQNSNRSFLASSDVEQNRLNNIGQFQQQQYNTALSQVLNNLVPQRQADANNAISTGLQSAQSPLQSLLAQTGLLGSVDAMTNSAAAKTSGGNTDWGKILQTGGSIAALFSDRRLKTDIEKVGEENGFNLYKFRYTAYPEKQYIGVMADEVEEVMPEAVSLVDGYKAVNYRMLGLEMREV